jgi:RPA family protein
MSADEDDGPGTREVAHRLFAAEFDDADFSYSESDEERAPNYVITPSGARVNRLFLAGVLTEEEWVNDDMLRARVVDPTGPFVTYAGQYQPDELAFLERTDPPAFLAVTGKARTFQPEDGDRVFTSVRPESISEVDADTRDRWVVEAAKQTIHRVETMAAAMETELSGEELVAALEADGVDATLASGIALALDHYGTTPAYLDALRELAESALETVAGERDEVGGLDIAPDEGGGNASSLAADEVSAEPTEATATTGEATDPTGGEFDPVSEGTAAEAEPGDSTTADSDDTAEASATTATAESRSGTTAETASETAAATDAEPEPSESEQIEAEVDAAIGDFETDDELGYFDADTDDIDDAGDFDPEDDDVLSEEEREEIESEYGTDFSTGSEVEPEPELEPDEEASEADAEAAASTDEAESEVEATAEAAEPETDAEASAESEPETDTEPEATETEPDDEAAADVPVDEAVMDAMDELDGGDGVARDELVSAVVDRTGADAEEVTDAIEDALMSGQCYEPDDGVLKPI